jgi:Arc/MetJ family transcription regulator
MKTTVEIDEKLLEEVQKLLGTHTIKETVNGSMQFVKRQRRLQEFADSLGTIELDLTPESLKRQRRRRTGHVSR